MLKSQIIITLNNLYWVLGEQRLGPYESYFADALKENGKNVNYINIHDLYNPNWKKLSSYSHRLPRKFDNALTLKHHNIISEKLINKYNTEKPAYIFIYNDCKVLPDTLDLFKKNGTKIIIFLGDDPNYLFVNKKSFLITVMNAEAVIVPDTGWIEGLKLLDIKNIIYSPIGTDKNVFFTMSPDVEQKKKYQTDILFVGTGYYLNAWGIKRAAVLNELTGFEFKLFGDNLWHEVLPYFPSLREHFICEPLTASEINTACNCAKLYPVVVNQGVINGVSTRVFDCLASGIFVLPEYKQDFDILFTGGEIDCFKSKSELKIKAQYYLRNEKEMNERTNKAREQLFKKYTLNTIAKNILEQIL